LADPLIVASAFIKRQNTPYPLASDPDDYWEAYDEYWRKIHGPRVLHVDGAQDRVTDLFVRYEQQHRLPSGPTSGWALPYDAPTDGHGILLADPAAGLVPHARPRFDGIAQLAFTTFDDLVTFRDSEKYGAKIAPDDRFFLSKLTIMIAEEITSVTRSDLPAPILLARLHQRRTGSTREEFRARWKGEHARMLLSSGAAKRHVRRYAQLSAITMEAEGGSWNREGDIIDGLTMMRFSTPEDVEAYLDESGDIAQDEASFTDGPEYFTALTHVMRDRVER
jgi:hypothetical protein